MKAVTLLRGGAGSARPGSVRFADLAHLCSTGSCWLPPHLIRTWADWGVPVGSGGHICPDRSAVPAHLLVSCPSLWWAPPLHVGASGLPAGGLSCSWGLGAAGLRLHRVCGSYVRRWGAGAPSAPSHGTESGPGPSPPVAPLEMLVAVGRQVVRGKPGTSCWKQGQQGGRQEAHLGWEPPPSPPLAALAPDVCPLGACLWWPWGRPCSLVLGWPWPWEGLLASRARSVPSLRAERLLSASVGPAPSRGADRWLGRQVPDEAVRSVGGGTEASGAVRPATPVHSCFYSSPRNQEPVPALGLVSSPGRGSPSLS